MGWKHVLHLAFNSQFETDTIKCTACSRAKFGRQNESFYVIREQNGSKLARIEIFQKSSSLENVLRVKIRNILHEPHNWASNSRLDPDLCKIYLENEVYLCGHEFWKNGCAGHGIFPKSSSGVPLLHFEDV